jgi:hypothetical protein
MATMKIADAFTQLLNGPLPLRVTAYDGSAAGPEDAPFGFEVKNERGLAYLMTAPGDLGLGRAPGSDPVTAYMLRGQRSASESDPAASFPTDVETVAALLGSDRAADRPFGDEQPVGRRHRIAAELQRLREPARRRRTTRST